MKTEIIKTEPITLAVQLWGTEKELERLTIIKDEIRDKLLASLQVQHVKSLKLENGATFVVTERQSLKVKDMQKALVWAQDKNVMKLDTGAILKIVRREIKLPSFFKIEKTEYLTIKKGGTYEKE